MASHDLRILVTGIQMMIQLNDLISKKFIGYLTLYALMENEVSGIKAQ